MKKTRSKKSCDTVLLRKQPSGLKGCLQLILTYLFIEWERGRRWEDLGTLGEVLNPEQQLMEAKSFLAYMYKCISLY